MTKIIRKAEMESFEGAPETFTGKVVVSGYFSREEPSRITGAVVHFEAGARTAWHTHPLGQTLIVTEGVGWTQVEGDPKIEFQEGDIMLCPKDKTLSRRYTARAYGLYCHLRSGRWYECHMMEHISDEQYLADIGEE